MLVLIMDPRHIERRQWVTKMHSKHFEPALRQNKACPVMAGTTYDGSSNDLLTEQKLKAPVSAFDSVF